MTDKQDAPPQGFEVKTVPGYVPAAVPNRDAIADGTTENAGVTNRPSEGPQQDASTLATSGGPADTTAPAGSDEKTTTSKGGKTSTKSSGETPEK